MKRVVLLAALGLAGCFNFDDDLKRCQQPGGQCFDAGAVDAGFSDAGSTDAGVADAGPADAGQGDAGSADAGAADSGQPDAGLPCDGGVLACGACVPRAPGSACANDAGVVACLSPVGTQCLPLQAPTGLAGSTTDPLLVHLQWTLPEVTPASWEISRDGALVTTVPGASTSWDDALAGAGTMAAPTGLVTSVGLADRVALQWQAPATDAGVVASYSLVGVFGSQRSPTATTTGRRGAPTVVSYLVRAQRSTATTTLYDAGLTASFSDVEAELGAITGAATSVVDSARSAVLLTASGFLVGTAPTSTYWVRAVSQLGPTAESAPQAGHRVPDPRVFVQWARSQPDGGFAAVPDLTGEAWLDAQAPLDTNLFYAAWLSADGGAGSALAPGPVLVRRTRHLFVFASAAAAVYTNGDLDTWYGLALTPYPGVGLLSASVGRNTCGARLDGGVWCAGDGGLPGSFFSSVTAGLVSTCGLDGRGAVTCWQADAGAAPGLDAGNLFRSLKGGDYIYAGVLTDAGAGCFTSQSTTCFSPPGPFVDVSPGYARAVGVMPDAGLTWWQTHPGGAVLPPLWPAEPVLSAALTTESHWVGGCSVVGDGGVRCWGDGSSAAAQLQAPPSEAASEVGVGYMFACGVFDGRNRCWGYMVTDLRTLPPAGHFTQVSTGPYASCGVQESGQVECWGNNQVHQLLTDAGLRPMPLVQQAQVVSTPRYGCSASSATGALSCWGEPGLVPATGGGSYESLVGTPRAVCGVQRGTAQVDCFSAPNVASLPITGAPLARKLAVAEVDTDAGAFSSWVAYGIALDGGLLTFAPLAAPAPPSLGPLVDLSCSALFCCAVSASGALSCWGDASAMGSPPAGAGFTRVAVSSTGTEPYVTGALGFGCALSADGLPHCFGNSGNPARFVAPPGRVVDLSGSYPGFCFVREDHHVVCTGLNERGQAPGLSR